MGKPKVVSLDDIRAAVAARVEEEKDQLPAEEEKRGGPGGGGVDGEFVVECLYLNEQGNGRLFNALHKGKFLFHKGMKMWLVFKKSHWERDYLDEAVAAVEAVADRYFEEAKRVGKDRHAAEEEGDKEKISKLKKLQGALYKGAGTLRTKRGRSNCMDFTHICSTPMAIRGDELDVNPWLLAVANGVIDLRTGEFREGRPEDHLHLASPVEWKGIDAPCPIWEKTLLEIFEDDGDMVYYLQQVLGYGITGLSNEGIFPVWTGKGRNGKSLIQRIVLHILGPLAGVIPSEMLLAQSRAGRSSSGASPDTMSLKGLRIAFAAETEAGEKFAASRVKHLTGNDPLEGRWPYDKFPVTFQPSHLLVLLTNFEPHVSADDEAFWRRMRLMEFGACFVDNPDPAKGEKQADKFLEDKLKEEAPGILAWLVKGCLWWLQDGFAVPVKVSEASKRYRRDEDNVQEFLDACCIDDPDRTVGATKLYTAFQDWWTKYVHKTRGCPSQKVFGKAMRLKGFETKRGKATEYLKIGLVSE